MDIIKNLKLDDWVYNPEAGDKLGSIFYDRSDDDFLKISPIKNKKNSFVFTIIVGCEDQAIFVSTIDDKDEEISVQKISSWLSRELKKY
mgnify:CR=1 FL=1